MKQQQKRLMNTREAIEYCGGHWHETTWRQWRVEGKGSKFIRLEHKVFYRLVDLDKWIDTHVLSSTSDPGMDAVSGKNRPGRREVATGKSARARGGRRATAGLQGGAN